jgi:regulator of protease activity HflC (stomatin/prohibitin superfamily)
MLFYIFIPLIFILSVSIKQINEYQRGVKFTLGKYTGILKPGIHLIIPVIQILTKVDQRTKAIDVPDQEAITKDNIPIKINAVIYYKIIDASRAIIQVENFYYAINQLAQTTMRNIVGEVTLDELLKNRDDIALKIRNQVDESSDKWGIEVEQIALKDVQIPDDLKRTIAKAAEAEREKRAAVIASEGEVLAAENVCKAARMLSEAPGALHLRTLQSINDMASDQSNTTVWMIPIEVLKAVEGLVDRLKTHPRQ